MTQDWTFKGFSRQFDGHVRQQLPRYELASVAVGLIARHYIPKMGTVYNLGASTGNIGRVLAPILAERGANLTALDECPDMIAAFDAKIRQGVKLEAILTKELALSGVQRPLYKEELTADAIEVFRYGDFKNSANLCHNGHACKLAATFKK